MVKLLDYLGLRHIDDQDHLMFSGDIFADRDNIFVYDNRGYNIPKLSPASNQFMITEELLYNAEITDQELSLLAQEHREIENMANPDQSALDLNREKINVQTRKLADLEKQIECVGEPRDLAGLLSIIS